MNRKPSERRQQLIRRALDKPINENDVYGEIAITHLLYNPEKRIEANKKLCNLGKWFQLPHPKGRNLKGEPDFTALKLIWAIYKGDNFLNKEAKQSIFDFFTKWDFESMYKSENHLFIFYVSRYLAAQYYKNAYFEPYDKTSEELVDESKKLISNFLVFRAKRGWAEFDSCGYGLEIANCLMTLIEFVQDSDIKDLAVKSLDVQVLDMIADSLDCLWGGAHGRIYEPSALDNANGQMFLLYYIFFGHEFSYKIKDKYSLELALSSHVPSKYVYDALNSKPDTYESFESKHLHCINQETPHKLVPQVEGSINKYTYVTPDYVIGAVNFQDDYPDESEAKWYAHHQQHEWDLSLKGDTDIKIFSHHPGNFGPEGEEHGYWTGDLGCCCGHFFCHKNTAMAMYDIPEGEMQFIHAHVPLRYFQTEEKENYLFLKRNNLSISLWFSNGFEIVQEGKYSGREIKSYGNKVAVVCRVNSQMPYQEFVSYTMENKPMFDKQNMTLECSRLYMNKEIRSIDEKPVKFPYPTYDSPIMKEEFGTGIIEIITKNGSTILNF